MPEIRKTWKRLLGDNSTGTTNTAMDLIIENDNTQKKEEEAGEDEEEEGVEDLDETGETEQEPRQKSNDVIDVPFTKDQVDQRVDALDEAIFDTEQELNRLDDKYQRALEKASEAQGYKQERHLRNAHECRREMERKEGRNEKRKDRLEVWQDIREIMVRAEESDIEESVDGMQLTLEDIEASTIIQALRDKRKNDERLEADIDELQDELRDELKIDIDQERYQREREEVAAHIGNRSVLSRDEKLRKDFEEVAEEKV